MDSDLRIPNHRNPSSQQQQQMSSGLMRYQSAPSSYFTNILNSTVSVDVVQEDDDEESIFASFINPPRNLAHDNQQKVVVSGNEAIDRSQFMAPMKHEDQYLCLHQQQQQQQQSSNDYSSASQIIYQSPSQLSAPKQTADISNPAVDNSSYGVPSSMAMGGGSGSSSNLIRHSSSPAGLFAHINVENGRLKGQTDFSSGLMTRTSNMEGKSMRLSESNDGSFSGNSASDYITGFPIGSWDDSAMLSDNFLKRFGDDNTSTLENQNVEGGNRPPTVLSHHLSLPSSSAELSAILELQDSVPCKIRAKRGFATHPRSIAERVRRTRISERMRKLQELVPNMDKQTNTADMLDLAVDYIKDLQKHVKTLSDKREKCTCSSQQKT